MKPVYLRFSDEEGKTTKTFTTCSLKTGMIDNIFDLAERAENLGKENIRIGEVKEFYMDLKSLIIAVFKYKFSYDELNDNVEQEELMNVFNNLCNNIGGEMKKN